MLRIGKVRKRDASWHPSISHCVHEPIPALYILKLEVKDLGLPPNFSRYLFAVNSTFAAAHEA